MRLPYAAETLIEQVQAKYKTASVTEGEPDGLGVVRSVTFDKTSSKWLSGFVDHLGDERIESIDEKNGQVTVTFSAGINADTRDEFALDSAEQVAKAEAKQSGQD